MLSQAVAKNATGAEMPVTTERAGPSRRTWLGRSDGRKFQPHSTLGVAARGVPAPLSARGHRLLAEETAQTLTGPQRPSWWPPTSNAATAI